MDGEEGQHRQGKMGSGKDTRSVSAANTWGGQFGCMSAGRFRAHSEHGRGYSVKTYFKYVILSRILAAGDSSLVSTLSSRGAESWVGNHG